MKLKVIQVSVLVLVAVTACSAPNMSSQEVSATADTSSPAANLTVSASPTPELVIATETQVNLITTEVMTPSLDLQSTPALTLIPMTPPSEVLLPEDLLFTQQMPDCILPCWYDLRVGESRLEDVVGFLENTLLFDMVTIPSSSPDTNSISFIDLHSMWIFDDGEWLSISFLIDPDSRLLSSIGFSFIHEETGQHLTIYRLISELGNPLLAMVRPEMTQSSEEGIIDILLVFQDGLLFTLQYPISLLESDSNLVGSLCVNQGPNAGSMQITEEYQEDMSELTPLQEWEIDTSIEAYNLIPFENVTDFSLEDLSTESRQDECIQIRLE